jgi:hypothetical protein
MPGETSGSVRLATMKEAQGLVDEHENGGCRKPHYIGGMTVNPCPCNRSAYVLCLACNEIVVRVYRGPCSHDLIEDIREWVAA